MLRKYSRINIPIIPIYPSSRSRALSRCHGSNHAQESGADVAAALPFYAASAAAELRDNARSHLRPTQRYTLILTGRRRWGPNGQPVKISAPSYLSIGPRSRPALTYETERALLWHITRGTDPPRKSQQCRALRSDGAASGMRVVARLLTLRIQDRGPAKHSARCAHAPSWGLPSTLAIRSRDASRKSPHILSKSNPAQAGVDGVVSDQICSAILVRAVTLQFSPHVWYQHG